MREIKANKRIGILLILSILLCEICLNEQPFRTYFFATPDSEINSSVQIHKEKGVICEQRLSGRTVTGEILRRMNRRVSDSVFRRSTVGFSFVDDLPRLFHSTIYLQTSQISQHTSGHMEMIRCIYQKDGKKRA